MAKRGPKQCPCLYRPNPAPQQKALLPIRMKPKHPMRVGKAKLKSAFIHARPHVRGEDPAPVRGFPAPSETPPRTWGRPVRAAMRRDTTGNTPTHVGKTHTRMRSKKLMEKHPHARGEDRRKWMTGEYQGETPPRTWGRPGSAEERAANVRNTPTHVGKTQPPAQPEIYFRKHPHARGEDPESFLPVRMTPLATWVIFRPLPTKYMPGWLRARFQGMGEGGTWLSGKRSLPIEASRLREADASALASQEERQPGARAVFPPLSGPPCPPSSIPIGGRNPGAPEAAPSAFFTTYNYISIKYRPQHFRARPRSKSPLDKLPRVPSYFAVPAEIRPSRGDKALFRKQLNRYRRRGELRGLALRAVKRAFILKMPPIPQTDGKQVFRLHI